MSYIYYKGREFKGECIYGTFPRNGDPRRFQPDSELCSDEEIAAHAEACRIFDECEAQGVKPQINSGCCKMVIDGVEVHACSSRYGLGAYCYEL